MLLISRAVVARTSSRQLAAFVGASASHHPLQHPRSTTSSCSLFSSSPPSPDLEDTETLVDVDPWNSPLRDNKKKRNQSTHRFRQHVNPLASQYQLPTLISEDWPTNVFTDCSKPLFCDIGCGKGGFLLDMAASCNDYNYLGLEIRPLVVKYAKERVARHDCSGRLEFLGCNANVDLARILERYQQADEKLLQRVSIQFPDPHFKARHAKRRVVTPELVETLARNLHPQGQIFLQSDIQSVLDDMRLQFRESPHFQDALSEEDEYLPGNVWGIPTERELSVLKQGLPVYRALFTLK
jgi:tRNA (guanine-N7-)-methyltransferase